MSLSFQLCDSKNYGWCRVFLLKSPGTKTSPLQVWHQTTLTAQPNSTEIGWGEGDGFALHLPCCNQTWNIHANLCVLWTLNGNWVTGWFSSFFKFWYILVPHPILGISGIRFCGRIWLWHPAGEAQLKHWTCLGLSGSMGTQSNWFPHGRHLLGQSYMDTLTL